MTCLEDLLVYYNNLDCGPFVQAVQKMAAFYKPHGVDFHKKAISVPGIARHLLFETARKEQAYFAVFGENEEDIQMRMRRNCPGGPSIVFNRHLEHMKTPIRPGSSKLVDTILGYDSNAMYLWSFNQLHATGCPIRQHEHTRFKPERHEKNMFMYLWLEFEAVRLNIEINHKLNRGVEHRIGTFRVDGFHPETKTVFEYNGCWYV